jgi:hypothetical protein
MKIKIKIIIIKIYIIKINTHSHTQHRSQVIHQTAVDQNQGYSKMIIGRLITVLFSFQIALGLEVGNSFSSVLVGK